ncbi:hypothetical protein F3Y22_tig00004797pilonHSYRG00112 [Hibiscus syriacus]|uniref:MULE transposase domain-containing protein n=1 Tax=Hibiscus syriacus TaxID=106335 RepID=A0A6A3CFM3_HIBSY|nr:hypothetical protein F3Y22_tig00004797pilonHSYRG00112 [Hibiscus syriacus]
MPIVDVNHHHNTIVFATAIIADEKSQYFEWVLQNFLEAMMNKSPISVVTDGDRAMKRAIKSVIPYAKHILCSWHLSRNAQANIGDPKFTAALSKCMASWWTSNEFDIQWRSVVSEFNVEKHPWVIEKGNTRHLWAQEYLNGPFFVNIRSTQRCESINASLTIALKHKKTYLDVVHAIEDGISRMRMNELKADYLSSQTKPFQITKLVDIESHAAEIYMRESFHVFQDELQRETLYRIQEEIHSLSDFKIVGLPCRHQLHVLKHLDYTYLPGSLIQRRWTKDVKASASNFFDLNVPPEVMQMASQPEQCSKQLLRPSTKKHKRKEVPKNKVEKKIRRCGFCNDEGHNKLTCPQVKLSLNTSTHPTSTDFFEDGMEWPFSPAHDDNDLHIS